MVPIPTFPENVVTPETFNVPVHVKLPEFKLPLITVEPSYAIVNLSVPQPFQLALNRTI